MKRILPVILLGITVGACHPMARAQSLGDVLGKKSREQKDDKKDKRDQMVATPNLPPYIGPKKRVAVADMEVKVQTQSYDNGYYSSDNSTVSVTPPQDFGTGLTEMLTTALAGTKRFIVIERSDRGLQDIQKEQQQQGVDDQTKAQVNKMFGAAVMVRGAVTEYTYRKSSSGVGGDILKSVGISRGEAEASVVLDIKMYDTTTGEILDSVKAEGRVKSSAGSLNIDTKNFKFGGSQFTSSPLGQATRQAIEKAVIRICKNMEKVIWEAKIADVVNDEGRGLELYLNVGTKDGIKVGDEFEVFHPGRTIMDPDNPGRVLRQTKGQRIGRCKVSSVEEDIAIAKGIEGEGFAAKDVIRLKDVGQGADAGPKQ